MTCKRALQSTSFDLNLLALKISGACDNAMLVVGELDANLPETMNQRNPCCTRFLLAALTLKSEKHIAISSATYLDVTPGVLSWVRRGSIIKELVPLRK